jgi:uncharacterized membrane protein
MKKRISAVFSLVVATITLGFLLNSNTSFAKKEDAKKKKVTKAKLGKKSTAKKKKAQPAKIKKGNVHLKKKKVIKRMGKGPVA